MPNRNECHRGNKHATVPNATQNRTVAAHIRDKAADRPRDNKTTSFSGCSPPRNHWRNQQIVTSGPQTAVHANNKSPAPATCARNQLNCAVNQGIKPELSYYTEHDEQG